MRTTKKGKQNKKNKNKKKKRKDHKKMLCYQKKNPQISRVRNSTTDWPACTSIMVFLVSKKGPISAKYGKT